MLFVTLHFSHLEEKFLTVEGRKLGVVARPLQSSIFKTDSEYVLNIYEYLQTPTVQLCDFASLHRLSKLRIKASSHLFWFCAFGFFFSLNLCSVFSFTQPYDFMCLV